MNTSTPITINYIKDKTTIAMVNIEGRIDAYLSELIEEKIGGLIENDHHYIILNFVNVRYFSSSGIRLLISMDRKLTELGGLFAIINMKDNVKNILKIVGLLDKFEIKKSEKEAIKFLIQGIS